MCGPGVGGPGGEGGGYSAAQYGADVATGRGDIGGGWTTSAEGMPSSADAPVSGTNGLGSPSGTGSTRGDLASSQTFADFLGQEPLTSSQVAKGLAAMTPIPMIGPLLSAMEYAGAFEGEPGNMGDIGGGPGADPHSPYSQGYAGPRTAPMPSSGSKLSGVIAPTIRTGVEFAAERGRTPEEIDAANRLRLSRERAYAEQRTNAESELLKALSLRDTSPESRLTESQPASARFVGLPPTLGQARHRWA